MGPDEEFEEIKHNTRTEVSMERVRVALDIFFQSEPTDEQVTKVIEMIIDRQGK